MPRMFALLALSAVLTTPAFSAEVTQAGLNDSVELGRVAALAPACTLRDEAWSADLRRSEIQSVTGATVHDDSALKATPGSNLVIGALSYAETEALEDFAEETPAAACNKLAADPVLKRADAMVQRFRANLPAS